MNSYKKFKAEFEQVLTLEEKLEFVRTLNRRSEFSAALHFYKELKPAFEQIEQHDHVLSCLGGICQSLGNLGRVNEIEHYLSEYKVYCQQYGDNRAKLKLYSLIGYISFSIEDYETAAEHYEMAISIASKLEDLTRSTYLLVNLQSAYLEINKLDDAATLSEHLTQLFKEDKESFSTLSYCAYLLNYMTVLIQKKDIQLFPFLMAELEHSKDYYKLKREQMYAAFLYGRYFELLDLNQKAIDYYEVAYEYLEDTQEAPYFRRVLIHLIAMLKKEGQFEAALNYSEILIEYLTNVERKKIQLKTLELSSQLKFEDMQELIYFDSLTNIHNRRYLEIQGNNWVTFANENNQPLICAIFDVDDFKRINDEFGHIIGDEVIQHIAYVLRQNIEDNMICARYGGDEFVILARSKEDYYAVFKQLFTAITSTPFSSALGTLQVEISMGVAMKRASDQITLKELISLADFALYESKEKGKNQLTINLNPFANV